MRRNKILQLLSDNRSAERVFNVVASGDDEVSVYLYDYIVSDDYWGGVSATTFVKELAGITASVVRLRVNSPGGDVFAARAMEAAIRGHSAKFIVHIDGLAASAASFLIMAADEIEISEGAFVMIHKAWTALWGNADDLRAEADLLDKIDGTLVKTYAQRTGQPEDEIAAWMAAETWLGADEAVEKGFADRKAAAESNTQARASAWNLRAYSNAPKPASKPAQNTLPEPAAEPAPEAPQAPDLSAMRRRLDLANRL